MNAIYRLECCRRCTTKRTNSIHFDGLVCWQLWNVECRLPRPMFSLTMQMVSNDQTSQKSTNFSSNKRIKCYDSLWWWMCSVSHFKVGYTQLNNLCGSFSWTSFDGRFLLCRRGSEKERTNDGDWNKKEMNKSYNNIEQKFRIQNMQILKRVHFLFRWKMKTHKILFKWFGAISMCVFLLLFFFSFLTFLLSPCTLTPVKENSLGVSDCKYARCKKSNGKNRDRPLSTLNHNKVSGCIL